MSVDNNVQAECWIPYGNTELPLVLLSKLGQNLYQCIFKNLIRHRVDTAAVHIGDEAGTPEHHSLQNTFIF